MNKTKTSDDELISLKHKFVRDTLAHHGIVREVHTALVADLVHGLEDFEEPKSDFEQRIDEALNRLLPPLGTEATTSPMQSDTLRIEWCIQTLNDIRDGGRPNLGDAYPTIISVIDALKRVIQSSKPINF